MADMTKRSSSSLISTICVFLLAILLIITLTNRWNINMSTFSGSLLEKNSHLQETINCSLTCSETSPLVTKRIADTHDPEECPEYFKWIHEDLKPWRVTGITREMVEKAKNVAHIRIVIVNGRVYVKKYKRVFQTRDVVTVWGMLQLLRMYPGRLPDLDLMFECDDRPVIKKREYSESNASTTPPPLFHYCGDELSYDIVFPDWSFWGWPELNIEPWEMLKEKLAEGNRKIEWKNREPYAYWKGNTLLGAARRDLVKCNATKKKDTKARIFHMDWNKDIKQGFVGSDLTNQCTYRYKIYAEGRSWSVSEKYMLACDSMSLIITPHYYDFFSRSLLPGIHYWPISEADKCKSIDSAVEMGNNYTEKAQNIGKAWSKFIQESLAMKYVYDYMFHLLSEYGKLMKYKPTVPRGAVEMCSEALFCSVTGKERRYRENPSLKVLLIRIHAPFLSNNVAALHSFPKEKRESCEASCHLVEKPKAQTRAKL